MRVLGIETSCDETAAAIVDGRRVLSDVVSSQVEFHRPYGGVVPEIASRHHLENLVPVLGECFRRAGLSPADLEGVAVTRGPGLIGALLVGVTAAKAIALSHDLPLAGVHHIEAHLYSVTLEHEIAFPHLALVASGGHTELYLVPAPRRYRRLARTRDDAAGEAYDKVGKLLGLGYPAGPRVDRLLQGYDGPAIPFPLPRMRDGSLDFSFSGLKTAALRMVESGRVRPLQDGEDPAAAPGLLEALHGFQEAVVDQLLDRATRALEGARPAPAGVVLCGGVSANSRLRARAAEHFGARGVPVWVPSAGLSTDNAAMVAALGEAMLRAGERDGLEICAEASIPLGEEGEGTA